MWWPRPRWKSELFTHFILLLFVSTCTTTTGTVMADEGQLCSSGSNMSAVVWTTAFCTILLVLVIVAIYFVYCKRKEHDWSSLWWKNSSDKNLVLQTLPPAKEQLQKNGGTDNPAFSADTNVGDHVTRTGLTRIVSVPLSTVEDGLLGIELSKKNEEDGRQMYTYKQKDGSKDRLVAMRLVFDNDQRQQCGGSPSDLNRALVELSRKYGLAFELETVKETATASLAVDENGNGTEKCGKSSNLLSAVRGKAQRLWNQRQAVFKTGDGDSGRSDKVTTVDDDLESGRAIAIAPAQKTSCSVTTVNENKTVEQRIAPVRNGSLKRYHTLEYGASAQSSPDSGVHCCTVNSSTEPVVPVQMEATVTQAAETTAAPTVVADDNCDDHADATVCDEKKTPAKPNADEPTGADTRHTTASNPPPPPPRKYSSQVIQAAAAAAAVVQQVTAPTTAAAPAADAVAPDAALPVIGYSASPDKAAATPAVPAKHEIRMDDDYYWCTTTSMAPPMSTFGKRPSVPDGTADSAGDSGGRSAVDQTGRNGIVGGIDDGAASTVALDDMDGGGIEDASLPPFSSDDDDDDDDNDDDGVFAGKTKFELQTTADEVSPSGDNGGGKDKATPAKASPRNGVFAAEPTAESKSPTKLPTLKLSLSSPLSSTASYCSSSCASSTASTSSSPTNNGSNNNSPIVSKIPVRRQSSSNCIGTVPVAVSTPLINGTAKKSIPLPLSRSGSRLAMWSSAN